MTSKVYEFLSDSGGNNFTESAPRPPVPGEENELQSNGGMSTQSSGSHKSHVSSKSNKSQSSNKSTKSAASTKGEITHSPAATPRKSNLEKSNCSSSQKLDHDEMEAPNGYEPEGSAANSPPFTENSTPPHLKWAENLNHLLGDSEGVELFKEYLNKEGGGALEVDFWFACQGLKRKNAQTTNIPSLVKAIYKHFVRNDGVRCLLKETKQEISDKINKRTSVDQYIYDTAENEVETYMRNVTYPAFLNSDFYVQYVQSYGDSPKSSHSSGSNSARPVSQSGPLPSLPEDKELDTQTVKTNMGPPLFHKVPSHKSYSRSESSGAKRMETILGPSTSTKQYPMYSSSSGRHSSYPNHVSYAPASAQDSELQSLSSDALTDDTMSVTDSSIDASHYNAKRQRKAMKSMAQQNRETNLALHSQFIPRTERGAPKDRNIAETDPARFAHLLIEKLQQVLQEREAGAKVDEKLRSLSSEVEDPASASFMKNTTATSIIPMMTAEEETAESILDQHCSRIWANSNHHTPSRSPGRHSPRNKSPDVQRLNKTLPAMPHRSRKRGEKLDLTSCDSGVGEDSCGKETHRHIHHHHHHHHPPRECRSTKHLEYEAQKYSMACIGGEFNSASRSFTSSDFHREVEPSRGRSRKSATRKNSDTSSHIDSGISMVFDKDSLLRNPLVTGPTSEKVMQWMMDSERVQEASSGYQDSEKGSSHKNNRHRLNQSAGASLQTHKQISKKAGHGTSRSASVERSTLLGPWSTMGTPQQILPSQPFAQDSQMPLPPPPNPTTQLEEARRRLEDQSRTPTLPTSAKRSDSSVRSSSVGPVKSKSFAGVPYRDKGKAPVSQSASQMRTMPSAKTVPSDLDISGGSQTFERPKNFKKPPPAPNTSMNTSTSAATATETIVGIYVGQEPIPYRHVFPGRCMTLAQFKTLIAKKGNFKYYFKRDSDEFGEGAVFEEICEDSAVLPMWQDKIVAKLEIIE